MRGSGAHAIASVWIVAGMFLVPMGRVWAQAETEGGMLEDLAPPIPADDEVATIGPDPGVPTLSLSYAMRLALESNPTLLGAGDNVATARLSESAARADFYPQVVPLLALSRDETQLGLEGRQRLPWTGGTIDTVLSARDVRGDLPQASADLRLRLIQPLLRGAGPNATFFDLRNARRARQTQERALERARQDLLVRVTEAYVRVIQQRQLLAVARQSLRRSDGLRRASESRMKVGLVSKLDVFRAELQASQAREAMVVAQSSLEAALESFRLVLGLPAHDPVEPAPLDLERELGEEPEPLLALVERALERRPDVAEARNRVDDARRGLDLARRDLLPQLDLSLDVAHTGFGATIEESLEHLAPEIGISVTTSYPVRRTADRARRAAGEIALRAARRDLDETIRLVEADVRNAARNVDRIMQSIALQRDGLSFAEQQHRLATLRYQRGLASNFDVVDAEGNLVSARTALVTLMAELMVARAQLRRATHELDVPVAVEAAVPLEGEIP